MKVIAVLMVVFLIAGFLFKALQTDHSPLDLEPPRHYAGKQRRNEGGKRKKGRA
jgi:hypothetical protein